MEEDTHIKRLDYQTVILQDESLKKFTGGFTSVPNAVLENAELSLGARMTYIMLLKYAWQKDFCFPAQERMATDLGLTSRSVRTFLKDYGIKPLGDFIVDRSECCRQEVSPCN